VRPGGLLAESRGCTSRAAARPVRRGHRHRPSQVQPCGPAMVAGLSPCSWGILGRLGACCAGFRGVGARLAPRAPKANTQSNPQLGVKHACEQAGSRPTPDPTRMHAKRRPRHGQERRPRRIQVGAPQACLLRAECTEAGSMSGEFVARLGGLDAFSVPHPQTPSSPGRPQCAAMGPPLRGSVCSASEEGCQSCEFREV